MLCKKIALIYTSRTTTGFAELYNTYCHQSPDYRPLALDENNTYLKLLPRQRMNLTAEYRNYAAQCGAIYQAAGMVPGIEWGFSETSLPD